MRKKRVKHFYMVKSLFQLENIQLQLGLITINYTWYKFGTIVDESGTNVEESVHKTSAGKSSAK